MTPTTVQRKLNHLLVRPVGGLRLMLVYVEKLLPVHISHCMINVHGVVGL